MLRTRAVLSLAMPLLVTSLAFSAPPPVRQDLKVEDLGVPVKSRSATSSAIVKAHDDGRWHLVVALEAYSGMEQDPPFLIYDLDLDSGKPRIVNGVVGRPGPYSPYRHRNGKAYFGQSRPASLLEYDLATGKTRRCGTVGKDYYLGIQSFAEDSAGRLYLGTWGRHVARFDPDSGEFLDYGPVGSDQGYGYVYTIAADSRYVYCGMAVSGKWYLVVLNQETRAWQEFFKPADPRQSSGGSVIRYQDGSVGFGGKYLIQDGKPVEVDPQVLRAKKPWTSSGDSVALAQAKEIGLEIDIDGMQPTNFNDGEVIVRWRKIGAPEWREARTTGADVRPNCVKRLAALPDGTLIGASAFYGNIFTFDPGTRQSRLAGVAPFSVYDILVNGPMVYFSGYPTAFAVYDTRRPWTFSKKKELGDSSQNPYVLQRGGKYNYQSALGADGRVYICGNHQRHDSGASLNWFDPAKPNEITHLRQGFEGHQPSDLVALDKGRYIVMGYGPQLVLFDTATHVVSKRIDLPAAVGKAGKLLAVDPNKVLSLTRIASETEDAAGKPGGRLCLVNTTTGAVEYVKTIEGRVFNGATSVDLKSEDARFTPGPDGCGWLFVDEYLSRIVPSDGTVEKIIRMKDRGRMFFVGDDLYIYNGGREYFNGFAGILRVRHVLSR